MKKLFVLLLVNVVMLSGCGESEQEKANYEAIESEAKDFSRPGGLGTLEDRVGKQGHLVIVGGDGKHSVSPPPARDAV